MAAAAAAAVVKAATSRFAADNASHVDFIAADAPRQLRLIAHRVLLVTDTVYMLRIWRYVQGP